MEKSNVGLRENGGNNEEYPGNGRGGEIQAS
jgi:hypothetical protein